ncbi:MAG: hypothetical protein GXY45_10260 [Ramlibacter sp.]|nr:hypothetical protein [Ramlibacter sp.]
MSNTKVTITGRVMRPAEVRTAIDAVTQRTVPTLHIWIEIEGQTRPALIQQSFGFNCHSGAQAAARRYKRGSVIKADVDMVHLQLTFTQAQHIHVLEGAPNDRP